MSSPASQAQPDTPQPSARYGSRRTGRGGLSGKLVVVAFVAMIVLCGIYIWSQYSNSTAADVTGQQAGWEQPDGDDHLRMYVDVTRDDPSKPGYCIVTALDYGKNEVGRREAVVPAGGEETTRITVDVTTRARPVAGSVYGCSSVLPGYLDADPA